MTKRSHSEFADGRQFADSAGADSEAKRHRSEVDAVGLIRARADDLIAALQALKNGSTDGISSLSRELGSAFQTVAGAHKPISHRALRGFEFPDPILIMPWTVEDITPELPPLPPADPELVQAAFTHPASSAAQQGALSYDRLEWVGDANLYGVASYLIFSTFGSLNPGKCSQLRERLLRNETLASYFLEYGFDKRANIPDGVRADGAFAKSHKEKKIPGDMFEAYVGAVLHSDSHRGATRVLLWMRVLWARTLKDEIRRLEMNPEMGRVPEMGEGKALDETASAKLRLGQLIRAPGIDLIYENAPNSQQNKFHKKPMFSIRLYLKGWGEEKKLLGWGTAYSKKEAGQKAAKMALENKKLMAVYEKKKRAYVESKAGVEPTAGVESKAGVESAKD